MKKYVFISALFSILSFNRCTTDFDLNADFKETPVIYGLLSSAETMHYIRINRAFLNDSINAVIEAANPNEIYYGDELTVTVQEYNGGTLVNTFTLQRVDGDTLGIEKDTTGIFASAPNILYRFTATLNPENYYKITAVNSVTGKTVTASTPIINTFKITHPNDESIFPQSFALSPQGIYQLSWLSGQDAKFYDLTLRFHYRTAEYFASGDSLHILSSEYADWTFNTNYTADNTNGGITLTYDIQGTSFYAFINNTFGPIDNPNIVRLPDSIQFFISAGGESLYNYIQYNNASAGLTEGQLADIYTNVDGGLGVFSTRFLKDGKIYPLSTQTRDSLACSNATAGLNFAPDQTQPGFPFCQ